VVQLGAARLASGGGGFLGLVAVFTGAWLVAALYPIFSRARPNPLLAIGSLGVAIFAAAGPVLLYAWTRGDADRAVFVIYQGSPCSSMGGGPGSLFVLATSWLVAFAAFAYAVASGPTPQRLLAGFGLGLGLCALTAAAMFPDPAVFARVLGCV